MWEIMLAQEMTKSAPHAICSGPSMASHVISLVSRHVRVIVSSASAVFRVSRRVVVRWKEDLNEKFCGGIVVASYDDGCSVDVEVSHHPLIRITRFFTNRDLFMWNPTAKEGNIASY